MSKNRKAEGVPSGKKTVVDLLKADLYDLGSSHARLDDLYMKSMENDERRAHLYRVWRTSVEEGRIEQQYLIPRTLRQASLLFSHDRSRILATTAWFRDLVARSSAETVIDAGCGHGTLVRILAEDDGSRSVIGVDQAENLIRVGEEASRRLPNACFVCAEFKDWQPPAPVELVVSNMGLDLHYSRPHLAPNELNPTGLALSERYLAQWDADVGPCLTSWRMWVDVGGCLAVVMRLNSVEATAAFLKSAAKAGWKWMPEQSKSIKTPQETFPGLVFRAVDGASGAPEDLDVAKWAAANGSFPDAAALAAYASTCVRPQKTDAERYDDGHTMRTETGVTEDGRAYTYRYATTGFRSFEIQ